MSTTFDIRRWATQAGIQTTGGFAVIAECVTMDELQRFAEIAIASAAGVQALSAAHKAAPQQEPASPIRIGWGKDYLDNGKPIDASAAPVPDFALAPQQEAQEPVAWESTTPGYIKYITQARYEKFSPKVQRWYKPYKCSSCAAPQPEALRLANNIHCGDSACKCSLNLAAAELLRQHARIVELEAQLEAIGAGGVQALSAAPAIKPLVWSDESGPTDKIRYNHVTANSRMIDAQQAAPQQEAQEPCPTCVALARTVMLDQVSFDRKPDCYGIRQITDDEGVEEWEDIRTSPDVAREEANDMMATGRGELYEVVPLWTTPQPSLTAKAAGSVLEDAARLDWLALAGPVSICVVIDRPHDGEVEVSTDDVTGYGKTLREAIDAVIAAQGGKDA